jgi:hypothetical protein
MQKGQNFDRRWTILGLLILCSLEAGEKKVQAVTEVRFRKEIVVFFFLAAFVRGPGLLTGALTSRRRSIYKGETRGCRP